MRRKHAPQALGLLVVVEQILFNDGQLVPVVRVSSSPLAFSTVMVLKALSLKG
jgi:hypothetical protein